MRGTIIDMSNQRSINELPRGCEVQKWVLCLAKVTLPCLRGHGCNEPGVTTPKQGATRGKALQERASLLERQKKQKFYPMQDDAMGRRFDDHKRRSSLVAVPSTTNSLSCHRSKKNRSRRSRKRDSHLTGNRQLAEPSHPSRNHLLNGEGAVERPIKAFVVVFAVLTGRLD